LLFDSKAYGSRVAEILALDEDGNRLMPLASGACSSASARSALEKQRSSDLFQEARAPEAALGGLWLYFGCSDECHKTVQEIESADASFWHAILHRQEPDPGNSSYWFRRVTGHPVYPKLQQAAREILERYPSAGFRLEETWDPFAFIDFCEQARRDPDSTSEHFALEIQRAEWQLLFDHCARATV
jgi:hypothetical protein